MEVTVFTFPAMKDNVRESNYIQYDKYNSNYKSRISAVLCVVLRQFRLIDSVLDASHWRAWRRDLGASPPTNPGPAQHLTHLE